MKREPRYFKIIEVSSPKAGVLIGPKDTSDTRLDIRDAMPFDKEGLEVELCGPFPNFRRSSKCMRIVSPTMKQLLEEYITDKSSVEFIPVKVISKEYGERTHYGLHFTKIYDVINLECSIYASAGEVRMITIPGIDRAKAEGLHIFNLRPATQETVISDELRRAINRNKLNLGFKYLELPCEYRKE